MQSIQMSVTGKVMSGKSKLNSFQMTFYTGPVAFMTLLVPAMALEQVVFAEALATKPLATVGFLLGSCCVAVVYNVVLFQSVHLLVHQSDAEKAAAAVLPTAEQVAVRPELSTVSQQLATKDVADATKAAGASGQ